MIPQVAVVTCCLAAVGAVIATVRATRVWKRTLNHREPPTGPTITNQQIDIHEAQSELLEEAFKLINEPGYGTMSVRADDIGTTYSSLGYLLLEQGRLEEAEEWLRRATDAGDSSAASSLGRVLQEQGRSREAAELARKAAEDTRAASTKRHERLRRERGRLAEVDEWLRRAADVEQERVNVASLVHSLRARLMQVERALAEAERKEEEQAKDQDQHGA
jgi:tetratricopeptide (TPR) repeat protein